MSDADAQQARGHLEHALQLRKQVAQDDADYLDDVIDTHKELAKCLENLGEEGEAKKHRKAAKLIKQALRDEE